MALFSRPVFPRTGIVTPTGDSPSIVGPRPLAWQQAVWELWRRLGEIRFPTAFLARQIGRLDWHVYIDGVELPHDAGLEAIDHAVRGMSRADACYLAALNLEVGGEGWLIEIEPDVRQIYSPVTPNVKALWEEAQNAGRLAMRFWTPDPTRPDQADSSVATALEPGEELLTLSALSRSQSRSRISQAGIVFFPSELFDVIDEDVADIQQDLEETITAGIEDERSPSAMVPIVMQAPNEYIQGVRHLVFERPYDDLIADKQERAIRRISLALDIPPEVLTGTGSSNHWNAWSVSNETYTSHLEPLATEVAALFADAIAWDRTDDRGVAPAVMVVPDSGPVLAKRSTVRDALDAAKLGAVGLGYVRESIGATEADAPTDEELEILRLIPRETGRWIEAEELTGPPRSDTPSLAASVAPAGLAEQVAVVHARQRLGAKLRNSPEYKNDPRLKGVDNEDVPFVLGDQLPTWAHAAIAEGLRSYTLCAGAEAAAALTTRIVATLALPTSEAISQVGWE